MRNTLRTVWLSAGVRLPGVSLAQTGVNSFGCENRNAQLSPIHSWKVILPWVVSAVKSGAISFIRTAMIILLFWVLFALELSRIVSSVNPFWRRCQFQWRLARGRQLLEEGGKPVTTVLLPDLLRGTVIPQ